MRAAIIHIAEDFLIGVLKMPKTVRFIRSDVDIQQRYLKFVVECPELPEVGPGEPIPLITPIYHKLEDGILVFDWNVKKDMDE